MYSLHFDTKSGLHGKRTDFFLKKRFLIKSPLSHDLKADRDFINNQTIVNRNHDILRKTFFNNHRMVSGKRHVGDGAASSKASSGKSHYSKYKHLGD